MTRHRAPRGLAIVEVVIATAIVAGMMALTYRTIAANAQAARQVAERRHAAMLARSVLDQLTAGPAAADQARLGRDGALTWRTARTPYGHGGALPLERVAVEVRDATGPVLTLQTLRVAR
jgi:Tfp pilus assembly protein PilV